MKILVTGANGLLGSNLVRELLSKDHQLKAFVLPTEDFSTLENLNIEKVYGNILNYNEVLNACQGVDAIFHLAASTAMWPSRCKMVTKVNVEGTQNVLKAALAVGVERLIHIGTANSFNAGPRHKPGDESSNYEAYKYRSNYMDSKYEAHKLVLQAVEDGLPAVIVNPTFMIGPYDARPSSAQMVLAVKEGKVIGYTPGGRNFICVKDAAVGIANALAMGRVGECYIIGNENLSYQEAFTKMASTANTQPPKLKLPKWAVLAYGFWGSVWAKVSSKQPTVSYTMARISCDDHYYSSAKAIAELDLPQTPIEQGIEESLEWLKIKNYQKNANQ